MSTGNPALAERGLFEAPQVLGMTPDVVPILQSALEQPEASRDPGRLSLMADRIGSMATDFGHKVKEKALPYIVTGVAMFGGELAVAGGASARPVSKPKPLAHLDAGKSGVPHLVSAGWVMEKPKPKPSTPHTSTQKTIRLGNKANELDPSYEAAMQRYKADKFRSGEPWVGSSYGLNLFVVCPSIPTRYYDPKESFSYDQQKGVAHVGFDSGSKWNYCDQTGTFSESAVVMVRQPKEKWKISENADGKRTVTGKYKAAGSKVVHTDGLREVLAHSYGMPRSYERVKADIPDVGDLCPDGANSKTIARLRIIATYKANQNQTFQIRPGTTAGTGMQSASAYYLSKPKDVCAK